MTEPVDSTSAAPAPAAQPRNPLHGLTLQAMVEGLANYFGWQELGERIPVRCFQSDPSVASSLKFLRKTPWAREKVESLYLFMLRDQRRYAAAAPAAAPSTSAPPAATPPATPD
ncbi:VF530 family DNA-binding protein [Simplicispira psychrophila]|uniref:VF530 family protein n=1 Tax=Simplicispira psychrophila TaxID=80882 RepID=UPI00068B58E9|nr:VF530 family protein [Simplicispira psychrophila]